MMSMHIISPSQWSCLCFTLCHVDGLTLSLCLLLSWYGKGHGHAHRRLLFVFISKDRFVCTDLASKDVCVTRFNEGHMTHNQRTTGTKVLARGVTCVKGLRPMFDRMTCDRFTRSPSTRPTSGTSACSVHSQRVSNVSNKERSWNIRMFGTGSIVCCENVDLCK